MCACVLWGGGEGAFRYRSEAEKEVKKKKKKKTRNQAIHNAHGYLFYLFIILQLHTYVSNDNIHIIISIN